MRIYRRLAGRCRPIFAFALFLSIADGLTGATPPAPSPSTAPLARWSITGTRLQSADLNFQILAPTGWTWSEDAAARQPAEQRYRFVARADARTFFRIIVHGHGLYENSPRSIQEFLDGSAVGNGKSGVTLTDVASSPRKSFAGSGYSYSYRMHLPQGGIALADGYVLAANRLYMLQYISADRAQIRQFNNFVDSFALLKPETQH